MHAFHIRPKPEHDPTGELGTFLIFAPTADDAVSYALAHTELGDFESASMLECEHHPEHDNPLCTVVREATTEEYLSAGFHEIGEPQCTSCGRGGFGLEVCPECIQCVDCGHDDDCMSAMK